MVFHFCTNENRPATACGGAVSAYAKWIAHPAEGWQITTVVSEETPGLPFGTAKGYVSVFLFHRARRLFF